MLISFRKHGIFFLNLLIPFNFAMKTFIIGAHLNKTVFDDE